MRAEIKVIRNIPGEPLVGRDIGHGTTVTVTNDVEGVVIFLAKHGLLPAGRRLFYYDSNDSLDEIIVRDGQYAGFFALPVIEFTGK